MQATYTSKYAVVEREIAPGVTVWQPESKKTLYPAFDSLRDAHIYMRAVEPDYTTGIVGNVSCIHLKELSNKE